MPEALRLALTTLTVLPVRGPGRLDRRTAGHAMELAPLVGLVLALLTSGLVHALRMGGAPDLLAAAVAVGLLALLTRGLHLDGLADVADGLGSYRDPAGTRAVMKAPDTGPLGISVLVLVLLTQVAALTAAFDQHRGTASLVVAVMTGRVAITWACTRAPAATEQGLGALVARTARPAATAAWVVALAVLAAAALGTQSDAPGSTTGRAVLALASVALGLAAAKALQAHLVRRVGGITGDVLGALCEVATTVALLVLALTP